MRAFIENEIYFTKLKFNATEEGSLLHIEYKHWINAYEALLESLPEDKVLVPKEPTDEMLWRDEAPFSPWRECEDCGIRTGASKNQQVMFYKAMLAANTKEVAE